MKAPTTTTLNSENLGISQLRAAAPQERDQQLKQGTLPWVAPQRIAFAKVVWLLEPLSCESEPLSGGGLTLQCFAFTGIGVVFTTCLILLGGGMVRANVVLVLRCLIV